MAEQQKIIFLDVDGVSASAQTRGSLKCWSQKSMGYRVIIILFFKHGHLEGSFIFRPNYLVTKKRGALWSCQVLHAANYAKVSFDKPCMEAEVRLDSCSACNAMMAFDAMRCHVMPSLLLNFANLTSKLSSPLGILGILVHTAG